MKKFLNYALGLILVGTVFVACGGDDDSGDSPSATSITLTASATTVDVGTAVTFTVTDNLGNNVTSTSTIAVDGADITGTSYTPEAAGTYSVTATNGGLTSAAVTITAESTVVANALAYNGTNYPLTESILVFWGGTDEDEDGTNDHALWSFIARTFPEGGGDATDYLQVSFINDLTAEGMTQNPNVDVTLLQTDAIILNESFFLNVFDDEFDNPEETNLSFVINEWDTTSEDNTMWTSSADYSTMFDGIEATLDYDGRFLGFQDSSGSRGVEFDYRNINVSDLTTISNEQMKQYSLYAFNLYSKR